MKIIEINIKCFGRLHDFSLKPNDGVNIVFGENESGKSTIMAFVKAMFYGLGTGEKRRQYEPWDGGRMSGSIEFEHDGKDYMLNRTFGATKSGDKTSLFNKSTGEEVAIPSDKEPGTFILGINIKSFINTVFIGQSGAAIEGENHEILARLTNLASAGDEHISKGEIEKRLKKGASTLESKKSSAILPELRKQKHELLESRAEMQTQLRESDALRESITLSSERKASLSKEKEFLASAADRLNKQSELEEIDALIAKHAQLEDIQKKFDELDAVFSGDNSEQIEEFLVNAKELLEAEKSQEIVIQSKKDQLAKLKKSAEGIDKSKMNTAKIINKYPQEIMSAFERYDSLMEEKNEIEIALENQASEKEDSYDPKMLMIVCAAVLIATILLGTFAHWGFFIAGLMAIVILVSYMLVYKKGVNVDGLTDDHINLNNVNDDLRALNAEMRPIFERLNVKSMEELDREYKDIERIQQQVLSIKSQRENVENEIAELNEELEDIRTRLRESLAIYHEAESNEEAFEIITRLDSLKNEHEKAATELTAVRETFEFMLNGRDFDSLQEYGRELRGDINLDVPEGFTSETVKARSAAITEQIEEITAQLIQQETELSLKPYSPQDMDALTDEIKNLNKRIEHYEFELEAIEEAQTALNEAFEEMQLDFGPMINYRAGRVLSGMTGEKYNSVFVSEKLVPSVAQAGSSDIRNCNSLSTGTYDQVYLSLRLALAGVMADEQLPVLLDDAFAQFDDTRMQNALAFINEDSKVGELGQVILFTCHKRILHAAKKLDMIDSVFSMEQTEKE